ncbi:VPDSG-CTERM sorting domain-containing protein [Pelagicoccus sp. SDUM812005]|uniref:VPDSG-CTERM sorting domain-containing protein n=1 Tax=Pelagicoccus sp. SDUM812005 TaxID=3041257 RepID=UPI00280E5536|nr:VPDSG-CTERM sorting domain-containing protein [Pelagicoccus sp. SDUM812005]MDQ8183612.1 VPDSG-CTERM sorting domain-containing protein [Pelagicoccus sp. SDUM812005]
MIKKICLIALLGLTAATTKAASISYEFTQGGFEEGAFVSGSFTADDINLNGQISGFFGSGEISDFSMSFSGNSLVSSFDLFFVDLFSLVYDLDGTIGDGFVLDLEGIAATNGLFAYDVGASPFAPFPPFVGGVTDLFSGQTSVSSELVIVTRSNVPDSGPTFALLGLGMLAIAGARKRIQRTN